MCELYASPRLHDISTAINKFDCLRRLLGSSTWFYQAEAAQRVAGTYNSILVGSEWVLVLKSVSFKLCTEQTRETAPAALDQFVD